MKTYGAWNSKAADCFENREKPVTNSGQCWPELVILNHWLSRNREPYLRIVSTSNLNPMHSAGRAAGESCGIDGFKFRIWNVADPKTLRGSFIDTFFLQEYTYCLYKCHLFSTFSYISHYVLESTTSTTFARVYTAQSSNC